MASLVPSARTVQLAASILQHVTDIESYLAEHHLPSPSFRPETPSNLPWPPELQTSLNAVLSAVDELQALLLGPLGWLISQMGHAYDLVSLHALYKFRVPEIIPLNGDISMTEIAQRCNADENSMSRLLQHAAANYLLTRPRPGHVAHTALSSMLATSPSLMDWVGSACEDMWPSASHVVPSLVTWPGEQALPHQTAHNLAEHTDVPFFASLQTDKLRADRFASAMSAMQKMSQFQPAAALDAYDWGSIAASSSNAVVVDIGGSRGDFAIALTEKHPSLHVVVQDMPDVVEQGRTRLPDGAVTRVTFQATDFFESQPRMLADAYLLRMVLHDWPDEFCLRILRNLVPALKAGARVIINDHCIPITGSLSLYQERQIRCQDIAMMAMFNGKERSEVEWRSLISKADPRFCFQSIKRLESSPLAVMEIVWSP